MITLSKRRISAVRDASGLPNDLVDIVGLYANPTSDEDKLEELLSIQRKSELKIGSGITVTWGDRPKSFRKKVYRIRIHSFDNSVVYPQPPYRFSFKTLLPGRINLQTDNGGPFNAEWTQQPFWNRANEAMKKLLDRF